MKRIFTLLLLLTLHHLAFAQGLAKITGNVQDANGNLVSAATVSLLRGKDSSLVKVAISDKSGSFEFSDLQEGKYLVSVSGVGFKPQLSKTVELTTADVTLSSLVLQPTSKDMANVTVTAKKPFVETKNVKTIIFIYSS